MLGNSFAQQIFFKNYSIQQGLLSSDNYRVTQDLDGYIWICSEAGVVKYDGSNFKKFTVIEGLLYNDIWEIHIDSKNRKWLNSFSNGIQYIERDTIKLVSNSEEVSQLYYYGEHEDTIFLYNGDVKGSKRYFVAPDGSFGEYTRFKHLKMRVWADYRDYGFMILTPEQRNSDTTYLFYDLETKSTRLLNSTMRFAKENTVSEIPVVSFININGYKDYYKIVKGGFKKIPLADTISRKITQILHDPASNYYFLKTPNWIYAYENFGLLKRNHEVERILNYTFPYFYKIGYIHIDSEHNVWITESRGDVYFIPEMSRWTSTVKIDESNSFDQNFLRPLALGDNMLMTSRSFNFYKYFKHNPHLLKIVENVKIVRKWTIANDNLYILFYGIIQAHPIEKNKKGELDVNWDWVKSKSWKVDDLALSFDFVNDNHIILGTGKIINLSNGETVEDLVFPPRTTCVTVLDSMVFYSHISGTKVVDLKQKTTLDLDIRNTEFIKIIQNKIVIGTKGGGVYLFKLKNREVKQTHFLLKGRDVNDGVFFDDKWYFATDRGIVVFEENNHNQLILDDICLNQKSLGVLVNSVSVNHDEIIAFTTKGLYRIDKFRFENRPKNTVNFDVTLTYSNNEVYNADGLMLGSNQNYVRFNFYPRVYYNLGEFHFRYMLSGIDTAWRFTSNFYVDYEDLPPGKYRFIIEASSNELTGFANRKNVAFDIDTPIHYKLWFQLILFAIVFMVLVLLSLGVRYYTLRKNRKRNLMRDLELKALRSQLNPHFIFNALNTMQSIVILKGEIEANKFIGAFSDLMRKVLDSSKSYKISLKEEMIFLDSYLTLESSRLNNELEYTIHTDLDIDPGRIIIYSMIFQPIIENAIIHGLIPKKTGTKRLFISMKVVDGHLLAVIKDNGIGRQKSLELGKNRNHKSWATSILKDKSTLLNTMKEEHLEIRTIDLEEDGVPQGTKVVVLMKVEIN